MSSTDSPPERTTLALPLWKKVVFSLIPLLLLFLVAEGILALFGVRPQLATEDPFVGFHSSVPLYVQEGDSATLTTAANKSAIFNAQRFERQKGPETFRIFTLGGSTTYGRPYADKTSFSGWLRELLPVADPGRDWQVINAGGISYASYRVARLMEELIEYEPDLFVIYTGHNEFLEERTYGELRDMSGAVRRAQAIAAQTRTWTALVDLRERLRRSPEARDDERTVLPREVQAILDRSAGLDPYQRDDTLRDSVLAHYRFSLRRMIELAESVGARVLFVSPASNLKDFSPFKSQLSDGLDESEVQLSRESLETAGSAMVDGRWTEALARIDAALAVDPRNADLLFARGRALFALGEHEPAGVAFQRSRDEDVGPLRALSAMQRTVSEVAQESGSLFIDYVAMLEEHSRQRLGHAVVGEEYFLDHVHPTIEAHRLLALAIVDTLAEQGIVRPAATWGRERVQALVERVEASIDRAEHARALANLALTLDWAGKQDESRALALQALDLGVEDEVVLMIVGRHRAIQGRSDEALSYFLRAVRVSRGNPIVHSQIGMLHAERRELEAAAAHFFLASQIWNDNDGYHRQLGTIMALRGRPESALVSFLDAQRLSPEDASLANRIQALLEQLGGSALPAAPSLAVTRYDSGYPRTLAQALPSPTTHEIPHGVWTEWFDGGGLKRFVDYVEGVPHGVSVEWDLDGAEVERLDYRNGVPLPEGGKE